MKNETSRAQATDDRPESAVERAERKRAAIPSNDQWIKAGGMLGESDIEREAWALGEAWRKAQTEP